MAEPIRVLIVDDVALVRESLTAYLEDFHFLVFSAASLLEAGKVLQGHQIHVAILDLRLPDGNGEDFARTMVQKWPNTGCILYTGSPDHQIPADLAAKRQIHPIVLQKPIMNMENFLELIREVAQKVES